MSHPHGEVSSAAVEDLTPPPDRRAQGAWSKARPLVAAALVAIAVGALARGQYFWGVVRNFELGFPWIVTGLAFAAAARRFCPSRRVPDIPAWSRLDTVVAVGLLIAAAALRFPALDRLPPGGFFDEAQNGVMGRQILAGDRPVFIGGATQMPALFFYLVAAALKIGGDDLVSVRGLAALLGTITAPVFYLFARRVHARPVAIAAGLLFAASRWHVTFSRVGFTGIFNPLLELLAAFFLIRALETGAKRHFVALGLTVGVGLQTYYAFNLFPIVLAALLLVRASSKRLPRPPLKTLAVGLGLAAVVALVVLAPLIHFAIREPQTFFQRTATVVIWNPEFHMDVRQTLRDHLRFHLQMFNYVGDVNARHNIPDAPQLGPVAGVLFLLGFGAVLARPLRWPGGAWLAWFAVMLLPGILTIEAPQAYRTIGILPALYLITAQGLELIADLVGSRQRGAARWLRPLLVTALIVAALVAASQDMRRYFLEQAPSQSVWDAHDSDHTEAARFVKQNLARDTVWVSPLHGDYPVFAFRLPGRPYRSFIASDHFPLDLTSLQTGSEGALYVLQAFEADLYPLFRQMYPHATLELHKDPFDRVSFVSIRVPRADIEAAKGSTLAQAGFTGAFYQNPNWEGSPVLVRREPAVMFHYHSEPMPDPFTVDFSTYLRILRDGDYDFEMVAAGPVLLMIDKALVLSQADFPPSFVPIRGRLHLAPGEHRLVVRYHEASYLSTVRLWWVPPSDEAKPSVIPLDLLRPVPMEQYVQFRDGLPRP
jgi:4-amino-4-deoxy-L-arabinose transferase-like glycosyltransferase